MNSRLSVAGQDDGINALQRHPPIVPFHISPQWICAYELLENGGFLAVQEVSGEVRMNEQMFVSVVSQFKFITEKLLPDDAYVLPANHRAQDLQEAGLLPHPASPVSTRIVWLWLMPSRICDR